MLLGELHEPAVELDRVDKQVDVVQPDLVARRHDVSIRGDRKFFFRQHDCGPIEFIHRFDRDRVVGHDDVSAACHQFGFARIRRCNGNHLRILKIALHECFDVTAERHCRFDTRLVDIRPFLDLAAFARHTVDIGDEVGFGELDCLGALQCGAHAEHPDLALVRLQIGDECPEARFHDFELRVEFFGKLLGEISINPLNLAGFRIAERDRIVERKLAYPQFLVLCYFEQARLCLLGEDGGCHPYPGNNACDQSSDFKSAI